MSEHLVQPEGTITATQLRDFARVRFYNYTIRQLVPRYIDSREAGGPGAPGETQTVLATRLRDCTMEASVYAALGQVAEPNAVLSRLIEHILEQSKQGKSSTAYLPKHQAHVEALLNDINSGAVALTSDLDARELDRHRELLTQDIRTMEFLSNLMD